MSAVSGLVEPPIATLTIFTAPGASYPPPRASPPHNFDAQPASVAARATSPELNAAARSSTGSSGEYATLPTAHSVAGTPTTSATITATTMIFARRDSRRNSRLPTRTPVRVPSTRPSAARWAVVGAGGGDFAGVRSAGRGVDSWTREPPAAIGASQCGHRPAEGGTARPQRGQAEGIDLR